MSHSLTSLAGKTRVSAFPWRVLLCLVGLMTAVVQGQPAREISADPRQESFEAVWRTVKEKHFDTNYGGVDWDKVREQYAPRVGDLKSDNELYDLLQQMLGELRQSHFMIIPPEAVIDPDAKDSANGVIGVELKLIDGRVMITSVKTKSNAARGGLRPGFVIRQVDGKTVEQITEPLVKSKILPALARLLMQRLVLARVNGKPGTSVQLVYLDALDRTRPVTIEREEQQGEMSLPLGNFPPQYTEFESKRLAGSIGYIRFNLFVISLAEKIRAAIRSMRDAPGIIIDLRGNPGGIGAMAIGIAGQLETRQLSLGTMHMRAGHINFVAFPQENPYAGPVAILIDGGSASTSEIFAAGLQESERAVIIGERSPGACLPSIFQKLPTGALFQFAIGDFKTAKDTLIEGRGVVPNIEVKLNRAGLLKGRDTQLDAAIKEVQKRARAAKK